MVLKNFRLPHPKGYDIVIINSSIIIIIVGFLLAINFTFDGHEMKISPDKNKENFDDAVIKITETKAGVHVSETDNNAFDENPETSVVKLCQRLVQIPSIDPGYELNTTTNDLADFIEDYLKDLDFAITVTRQRFAKDHSNLIIRLHANKNNKDESNQKDDALCFAGHLDVMPPQEPKSWKHFSPFSGIIEDGKLYGRGISDMKAAVGSMLQAFREIALESRLNLKRDLIIALTSGESFNCLGAKHMVRGGLLKDVGAMVIGEPTDNKVASAHRGCLFTRFEAKGKEGLSAVIAPEDNAILKMSNFLSRVSNSLSQIFSDDNNNANHHPLLGKTVFNPTSISTGDHQNIKDGNMNSAVNIVPSLCSSSMVFRTIPGHSKELILRELKAEVDVGVKSNPNNNISIYMGQWKSAVETNPRHPFVQLIINSLDDLRKSTEEVIGMPYYTDGSVFCSQSLDPDKPKKPVIPFVISGPGSEHQSGVKNEHCYLSKINEAKRFYKNIMLNYCVR